MRNVEPLSLLEISRAVCGSLEEKSSHCMLDVVKRVVIDSRMVSPGDFFVALAGTRTDGHVFLKEALEKGAEGCLASHSFGGIPKDRLIVVENCEKALMRLASWYREKINVPIIGITGSSGKSTAKEMTAGLLSLQFPVLKAPGSYNNEIGVPLTLLSWKKGDQAVVLEMAMRGKGQIAELCRIAFPNIGFITSIGEAHIGLLGSLRSIADAKGELLEALPEDGLAFLPEGDAWTDYLRHRCRCDVRTFGLNEKAWVYAKDVRQSWEGTKARLVSPHGETDIFLRLLGKHNLLNFLGSAAVALSLGVPIEKIQEGAPFCETLHGRLEVRKGKEGNLILDDSYNANPSSLEAAFQVMVELPSNGRKILVFGDMLELGDFAAASHRIAGERLVQLGFHALFAIGELTQETVKEARKAGLNKVSHYSTHEELLEELRKFLRPADVLLVKGSRKMALEHVVEGLL